MSTDPAPTGPREDLPGVERLLTLSDGVVAIAITLLVLQLNVPPPTHADSTSASELARQLDDDEPEGAFLHAIMRRHLVLSLPFTSARSRPCRRSRFSPRILRLAWSVSCG